ncbi:MAG: ATPase [Deltaproteobacteria bacterium]|jgi:F-type H+-transporting ATPase subunit b|nr:ATPase [Deltaproteobacteria bacterium]
MIKVIPDITTLYQMVNFLVLLFVLNLVLYKPIRKVILDRKAKIEGMQKKAKKASSDLVAGEKAYKDGLKTARAEGLKEKETFIDEASKEEKEILDKINKKAQANLAQIREQVAKETEQARKSLEDEVELYARTIGEKILGRAC